MQRTWSWRPEGAFAPAEIPASLAEAVHADPALRDSPFLVLLPPLWDHHGHVAALGALLEQADLRGARSPEEALARLAGPASSLPADAWLEGFGWDQNLWGGAFPHRRLLDRPFPDRPVLLRRIDGHAAWANTAALRAGGVEESTPAPPGGLILRDEGSPTGVLVDSAVDLVAGRMPPPDPESLRRQLRSGLQALKARGLCGATDMGLERTHVAVLRRMEADGDFPIPLDGYLDVAKTGLDGLPLHRGARFRVAGGKLYADGALGSRGACLEEEYADAPGERGLLLWEPVALVEAVRRLREIGLPPAIHIIGDRAARIALDALEAAGWPTGARLEHAQLLSDDSIRRMRKGRVTASIQPCHYLSDHRWAAERLGARMDRAYPWGRLRRAGLDLLLGTDFPIEEPDPLRNLLALLTREPVRERLTLAEAFRASAPPPGRRPAGQITAVGCRARPDEGEAGWLEGAAARSIHGSGA